MRIAAGLAAVAMLALLAPSASAQSFNCRYAKLPVEVAICQNDYLAQLDEEMASTYFRTVNSMRAAGMYRALRQYRRAHRRWLRRRNACGYDSACIARAYHRWTATLGTW